MARLSPNQRQRAEQARPTVSILSPLRYPGSKRRLAGYVERVLDANGLRPRLFVEPFAGGASVALQLLNDERVDAIGLADADEMVAAFWKTVFSDDRWLCERVKRGSVTLNAWRRYKASRSRSRRGLAWKCLFLNRTSFSGILANDAGPIGGYQQESDYLIDCRFPRETLTRRIQQAAALSQRVDFVWHSDWRMTLRRLSRRRNTFVYLDPPFFRKAESLYRRYFSLDDHEELRDYLAQASHPWLLSYDVAPEIARLYSVKRIHVELLYSTSGSRGNHAQRELIMTNLERLPLRTKLWRPSSAW